MIIILYEEIKKIFRQKKMVLFLVSLMLLNVYYISMLTKGEGAMRNYVSLFDNVAVDEVMPLLYTYDIDSHDMSYLASNIKRQVDYSKGYSNNIRELLKETTELSKENDTSSISAKYDKYIIDKYAGRSIESFVNPDGITQFLNNNFSTLLIIVFALAFCSKTYQIERESSVYNVQQSSLHNKTLVFTKSIAVFIVIALVALLFLAIDYALFDSYVGVGTMNLPLFYLPAFATTPLNMSILSFVVLKLVFNVVGIWCMVLLIAFLTLVFKSSGFSFAVGGAILFVLESTKHIFMRAYNPLNLFSMVNSFKDINHKIVFGRIILEPNFLISFVLGLCVLLIVLTQKTYLKRWRKV